MPEHRVVFGPDDVGLVRGADVNERTVADLGENERKDYERNLKKHLWSMHGLDTTAIDLHPLTAEDLEACHYAMHHYEMFQIDHVHSRAQYPHVYADRLTHKRVVAATAWIEEARGEREE